MTPYFRTSYRLYARPSEGGSQAIYVSDGGDSLVVAVDGEDPLFIPDSICESHPVPAPEDAQGSDLLERCRQFTKVEFEMTEVQLLTAVENAFADEFPGVEFWMILYEGPMEEREFSTEDGLKSTYRCGAAALSWLPESLKEVQPYSFFSPQQVDIEL